MKILFDLRWATDEIAGIGRFSTELARALDARDDTDVTVLTCCDDQDAQVPGMRVVRIHDPQQPLRLHQEMLMARHINRLAPDVVFSPIFYMGSLGRRYPLVLTIHDMIPFHYPQAPHHTDLLGQIGWRVFYGSKLLIRWLLGHADRVATVSEAARREIERDLLDVPVAVIPNGVDQLAPAPVRERDSDDVLYMGVFSQHKNVENLIEALAYAPEVTLHLLSKIPEARRTDLQVYAEERGVGDRIVFHNRVSDQRYAELLASARCLTTASRLEGFGLSIIEAQQAACPVTCSDIEVFHEVAGAAAEFFDPEDPRDIARSWAAVADPVRARELATAGVENARRFTWRRSAEAAMEVFRDVIALRGTRP